MGVQVQAVVVILVAVVADIQTAAVAEAAILTHHTLPVDR
jgi:hypothetical protein